MPGSHRCISFLSLSLSVAIACVACHRASPGSDAARIDARSDGDALADAPTADGTPVDAATDAPPTPPSEARVTITAMGDIYIPRRIADSMASHRREGGLLWVVSAVSPVIADREIAFVDLETPLTASFRPPGSGLVPVTGVPADAARAMSRAGFDVIQLANNHAYDQTGDGLDETREALRAASVPSVGAGRTDDEAYGPTVVEREGLRVAFVAFTERTNDGPGRNANAVRVARVEEPERALAAVTAAREHADVVVAGVHWSRDFVRAVSDRQRQLARLLVDAGADLVVGTGPHLLQRVERTTSPRGDAIIAYSLGDLVSAYGSRYRHGVTPPASRTPNPQLDDPAARDGALLRVTFTRPAPGRVALQLLSAVAVWRTIDDEGVRVVPDRALDDSLRAERIRAVSAALGPAVRVRP